MSTVSFSTRPQKKYYSYKNDGCIYSISLTEPTKKAEGGGVWYCYFKCTPYAKLDTGETYLLYRSTATSNVYEPLSSSSYYISATSNSQGTQKVAYKYYLNGKYVDYDVANNGYYTKNGSTHYDCPVSAEELPQVSYEGVVYYFDTLISNGDSYKSGVFSPMNVDDGDLSTKTTYGSLLLDKVEDSITINAFTTGVANLPEYLTGTDLTKQYCINNSTIVYTVPANYLCVYGKLFIEKLNEYMKGYGDAIIEKYASEGLKPYKSATISCATTDAPKGTITTSVELATSSKSKKAKADESTTNE